MDPLCIVAPGDPYEPSASRENAWTEAARWVRDRQLNSNRTPLAGLADGSVLVKNTSGSDRDRGEVLAVDTPLVTPADNLKEFQRRIGLAGKVPAAQHAGQFVVLTQPIKNGSIGPAVASGAVAVKIKMVSASDTYADVLAGDCTQLGSSNSGAARILSVESGTGTKWAYVRLGAGAGSSGGAVILATVSSQVSANSNLYYAKDYTTNQPIYMDPVDPINPQQAPIFIPILSTIVIPSGSYIGLSKQKIKVNTLDCYWGWCIDPYNALYRCP